MVGNPADIPDDAVVHRVGGGTVSNLRLSHLDAQELPPGISVLRGGTPQEAAAQMRGAFGRSKKWQAACSVVATVTAGALRQAGFEVVPDPTNRFANHARIIHPQAQAGFADDALAQLAQMMTTTTGC